MDNVNYNFRIVTELYDAKKKSSQKSLYNKPITIILVAIIECMLYDFIIRIKGYKWDPFPNMTTRIAQSIRGINDTDQMSKLINICRDEDLLQDATKGSFYDELEEVNKIRNRLHIQNKYGYSASDEHRVFTASNLLLVQETFKHVCDVLCNVYPRWNQSPIPMSDFPEPWN